MKIDVEFLEGTKLAANFKNYKVVCDQPVKAGGTGEFPAPFDFFASSLALCAGYYVKTFCDKRDIPTEGVRVTQVNTKKEGQEDGLQQRFELEIVLPESFPNKYRKAVETAVKSCTVKKVIENAPEFQVNLNSLKY